MKVIRQNFRKFLTSLKEIWFLNVETSKVSEFATVRSKLWFPISDKAANTHIFVLVHLNVNGWNWPEQQIGWIIRGHASRRKHWNSRGCTKIIVSLARICNNRLPNVMPELYFRCKFSTRSRSLRCSTVLTVVLGLDSIHLAFMARLWQPGTVKWPPGVVEWPPGTAKSSLQTPQQSFYSSLRSF